jgi:3'-5' exonuclease
MNQIITLDIETIPAQRQDIKAYIAETVKPPATFKKAESIADWYKEQAPSAIIEAVEKTSFDAVPQVIHGMNERENLIGLNDALSKVRQADWYSTAIVGHNVSAFDLRFLLQRFIVNQVKPHPIIVRGAQAKPWESEKVYDTMVQFAGTGNRISLDKLCLALGLPGKGDISGADVWPMVQAGKLKEVADYCADDVIKTRAVFKRMTFATVDQHEFEDVAA